MNTPTSEASRVVPLLYRVEEVCDLLQVSRTQVYDLLRTKKIASVKIGRARRVPVDAVNDYLAAVATENDEVSA